MKEQKRAWIYCRIDAPEDVHGSLKNQKKELYDYAEQMGFSVVGSSEDMGNSLDMDRLGLLQIIKSAEEGKMDTVLIKKLDRLGRDILKTQELLKRLEQMGIRFYSPMEGELCHNNLFYGNKPMEEML